MEVELHFKIGETVFLRHDPEQLERLVTRLQIGMAGEVLYECSSGTLTSWHYASELDKTPNVLKSLGVTGEE